MPATTCGLAEIHVIAGMARSYGAKPVPLNP
jgi:hypothetical protein